MALTAAEWARLRNSEDREEYREAAYAELPIQTWLEVITDYPDLCYFVAHNKKVPLEILKILARV